MRESRALRSSFLSRSTSFSTFNRKLHKMVLAKLISVMYTDKGWKRIQIDWAEWGGFICFGIDLQVWARLRRVFGLRTRRRGGGKRHCIVQFGSCRDAHDHDLLSCGVAISAPGPCGHAL